MAANDGVQLLLDVWPFLPSIFDNSSPAAWPHEKGEAVSPLLLWYTWNGEANDKAWIDEMGRALLEIRKVAKKERCIRSQAPVYLNTSLGDTPVKLIYRQNIEKLGKIRAKYDPRNVMGNAGGFKIPLVFK